MKLGAMKDTSNYICRTPRRDKTNGATFLKDRNGGSIIIDFDNHETLILLKKQWWRLFE